MGFPTHFGQRNCSLGLQVAIKVLSPEFAANPDLLVSPRFFRRGEAVGMYDE